MSSFIGQLRISLGLDSAAFESGAKRAAAEVNTLGSKAEAAGFKVGSMTKALVAGASAFAATAIVQQLKSAVTGALEYASSLSEAAQQMGVTVESLQQFRLLAEQSGVSTETMDKALQKLTRSMGEAAAGGKKQSSAFDELGLSLRDASGHMKTADQILPEIAGALEKVASPAERARLEVALFGKSGQDLEPLLGQGEAAIRSFMQQAQAAGIIISKDLADKSDAAADKIAFLQKKLEMRWNVAVAEHAADIEHIVDVLDRMVDRFFKLITAMQAFANSPAGKFLARLNGVASNFNPVTGLANAGIKALDASGGGGAPAPKPTNTPSSGGALLRLPGTSGAFKPGQGPLANFSGGALLGSNIGNIAAQAPGLRAPLFENVLYQSEQIQLELIKVNKATKDTADETNKSTVIIAKSFADMAKDTVNALENMSNSIRSGDFLSILGSGVKLLMELGKIGVFGKATAERLNTIPGFANGTNYAPGGLALVGERGPELVNLPRGSKVWPNGTGPGGGDIINNYYTLPSDQFWGRVNAGHALAAQAGGEIGYRKVARAGSRRLA